MNREQQELVNAIARLQQDQRIFATRTLDTDAEIARLQALRNDSARQETVLQDEINSFALRLGLLLVSQQLPVDLAKVPGTIVRCVIDRNVYDRTQWGVDLGDLGRILGYDVGDNTYKIAWKGDLVELDEDEEEEEPYECWHNRDQFELV